MDTIPMCWKCCESIMEYNPVEGFYEFIGCASDVDINCYADAQERCPLFEGEIHA